MTDPPAWWDGAGPWAVADAPPAEPFAYVDGERTTADEIAELLDGIGLDAGAFVSADTRRINKMLAGAELDEADRELALEAIAALRLLDVGHAARRSPRRMSPATERRRSALHARFFRDYVRQHFPVLTGDREIDQPKMEKLYAAAHAAANAQRTADWRDWVKVCRRCGERFDAARSDAQYCSPACRAAAHRGSSSSSVCVECGRAPVDSPRSRYCGDGCRAAADRKRKRRGRQVNSS